MSTKEEKEVAIVNANVRELMKLKHGRDAIWTVLSFCEMYSSMPGDFEAGKRNVGLDIISMLNDADPAIYPNLMLENIENA